MTQVNSNAFVMPFTAVVVLFTASCSQRPLFPEEFELTRVLYETKTTHSLGPGGLNESFTIYELPREVSATIAAKGLPYLNSLPSVARQKKNFEPPRVETWLGCPECENPKTLTATGPYWAPFVAWNETPVPKEVRWLRRGQESDCQEE